MLQRSRRHFTLAVAAAAAGLMSLQAPAAEVFPDRPLSLVVPYGAGSTTDIFARVVAEALSKELSQPVVVKNVSGAGGTLGLRQMLRDPADGYSLAVVTTSSIAINRMFYKKLPYDSLDDISIVGVTSASPNVLVVSASSDIKTVQDLSRRQGTADPLRYNSMGNGTSQQLLSVLLSKLGNMGAQHIPYRGQDGILGMVSGQTDFSFASVPSVAGLVDGGRLRILATSGSAAPSRYPNTPTLVSLGYKGFEEGNSWYGIGLSSKAPAATKARLTEALGRVAVKPEVVKLLADAGFEPVAPMKQAEIEQFTRRQVEFWGALVKESGVEAE